MNTTTKIGQAMINTLIMPDYEEVRFENRDINKIAATQNLK